MKYMILGFMVACSGAPDVASTEQALCPTCEGENPPCCCQSPILIDVAGDGIRLTSWANGVAFALRPEYRPSARAWTEPNSDDAWLVLDRNGDGIINDGTEMFGNNTPQPQPAVGESKNGFLALAQYDDNGDKIINESDAIYKRLRLWQDKNHDGVSQPEELHALPDLCVAGISVAYSSARRVDEHGNSFRYQAAVYGTPNSTVGMTAWDVWLVGTRPEPIVSDDAIGIVHQAVRPGDPAELQRCYNAAAGGQNAWLDYCNTVPTSIRMSCRNIASDNEQTKRNWCYNYWGDFIGACTP